jgi:Methyltransferase domain
MNTRFLRAALREPLSAALEVFNVRSSEHRLVLTPRVDAPIVAEDMLWTYHARPFMDDERFLRAYQRAVKAGGFDYGIRWRTHAILWAAQLGARLEGAFVECGTGKGFMASAICDYLDWRERPFYLYDTFEPAREERVQPFYADGTQAVRENFSEWPGVELVVGRVPDTLLDTEHVAFLHVDLNDAQAEHAAVRHFWPRLVAGAPVIFDDYGRIGYEQERASARQIASELGFEVLALPTGQGVALKR